MSYKHTVCVGMVGAGYGCLLHCRSYKKVIGIDIRLKSIYSRTATKAEQAAAEYGFEKVVSSFEELLADPEIDVIDIVTPPFLHMSMARQALEAGKHVICEKPLTGYFGMPGDKTPIGSVSKEKMYQHVLQELNNLKITAANSKGQFFYAENRLYAPPVQRAAQIIQAKKSKILYLKAEGSLKGSSSPVAGEWSKTGGGTLARVGSHSIAGVLYLKQAEAEAREEAIGIQNVLADTSFTTGCLSEYDHRHISADPIDVEDFSSVIITFTDGTKAVVLSADTVLGGTKNYIEIYCNDNAMTCNIVPNDLLNTYFLDEDGLEDITISEMLPSKLGWNKNFVAEETIRGHLGELQDFMECIIENRKPVCSLELACQSIQVVYAAYLSSETGRRVDF